MATPSQRRENATRRCAGWQGENKMRINVQKAIKGKKILYHLDIGSEDNGKPFRLRVYQNLIQKDGDNEFLEFPIRNARIYVTDKGTKILRPKKGWNVFYIFVPVGANEKSEVFIYYSDPKAYSYKFLIQQENRGVSGGAIVCTRTTEILYLWEKTGRAYKEPEKEYRIMDITGEEKPYSENTEL
jgi:hypothetical protein